MPHSPAPRFPRLSRMYPSMPHVGPQEFLCQKEPNANRSEWTNSNVTRTTKHILNFGRKALYFPVVCAVQGAVSNYQYAVIQHCTTYGLQNTTLVHLEKWKICFDGNGNWLLRHRWHQVLFAPWRNIKIARNSFLWKSNFAVFTPAIFVLRLIPELILGRGDTKNLSMTPTNFANFHCWNK